MQDGFDFSFAAIDFGDPVYGGLDFEASIGFKDVQSAVKEAVMIVGQCPFCKFGEFKDKVKSLFGGQLSELAGNCGEMFVGVD